ncbi:uncharacterized protein LOC135395179 [Ornithodoros turicata]|uniref:uncharacterized protein LOC135395179 n=1 Tax=Ornithodoros turicata TaxID=34597 RepID=UPI0031391281
MEPCSMLDPQPGTSTGKRHSKIKCETPQPPLLCSSTDRSSKTSSEESYLSYLGRMAVSGTDTHNNSQEASTSVILNFCQIRVLKHYFRLLCFVGWRPMFAVPNTHGCYGCLQSFNTFYVSCVIALMCVGHVLQYMACFRRDSLLSYKKSDSPISPSWIQSCSGSVFAVYILPAFLQLVAYFVTFCNMRAQDSEQFESLMEKVCLQMAVTDIWPIARKRITQRLRGVHVAGLIWILSSIGSLGINAFGIRSIHFDFISDEDIWKRCLLVTVLLATLLFHDIICMAIAVTYSIQCQLLLVYLQNLNQSVRERTISILSFVKGIEEARKAVKYLNKKQALAVTLQMIWLFSRTAVCIYALLMTPWDNVIRFVAALLNVSLWLCLVLLPLVQACRLSSACNHIREVGLELRARPFGYIDEPQEDLNSLLLFTSSLRIQAKLCALPVTKRTVISLFLLIGICLFIAVELNLVRFGP